MAECMHNDIDPTNNMCRDCYTIFDEDEMIDNGM